MTNSIYMWLYGGYGDCTCAYLNGGGGIKNIIAEGKCGKGSMHWDKLVSIKQINPNIITRAIVMSGNTASASLVSANPYIDEVVRIPTLRNVNTVNAKVKEYILKHITSHKDLDDFVRTNVQNYKQKTNEIYLNNIEKDIYNRIIKETNGKYVVIHPYASIKTRKPVHDSKYIKLAEKIYENTGLRSIVLGGSFNKKAILTDGTQINSTISEDFCYKSDKIINLVNTSTLPLGTKFVSNAACVIGTWSCHTTVGMSLCKPTVIYTTQKATTFLNKIKVRKFKKGALLNKTFITDNITDQIISKTISQISKHM